MSAAAFAAGLFLVAVAVVDLVWTTVAAGSGAGPLTGRLARGLWRLALAVHRRRPSHALLSASGVSVVFAVLGAWLTLVLAGWLLVFASTDGAVRATETGAPAGMADRLYFTGYTVFTLGNGDFSPGSGIWQLATVAAVGSGLFLVTLSITYLVPVASAVALRRQLASYVASLGATPHAILVRSWNGSDFGTLSQHLVSLTPLLHTSRQQHLAYPVLHYFHSREPDSAAAPNIVNLSQALHLLARGVAPEARPDQALLEPLDRSIAAFLATLQGAHVAPSDAVALPGLEALRSAGIPVVSDAHYESSQAESEARRALLGGFLVDDGWPIDRREDVA